MGHGNLLRAGALAVGALAIGAGCELIGGFETFQGAGGGSSTSSSSSSSSSGGGGTPGCTASTPPGTGGPAMKLAKLVDGACFWIDETEVTVAHYAAFLSSDPSDESPECAGNTTFAPSCAGDAGTQPEAHPVTCVDWCDARAYCKSVSKRLCRGDGAGNPANAKKSEWFAACVGEAATTYPYGATYQPDTCNGGDNHESGCNGGGSCSLVEAGSLSGCHGELGASDLSGNAAEWVDECTSTSASGDCAVRGGAANSDSSALRCEGSTVAPRLTNNKLIGFRCCADAL